MFYTFISLVSGQELKQQSRNLEAEAEAMKGLLRTAYSLKTISPGIAPFIHNVLGPPPLVTSL